MISSTAAVARGMRGGARGYVTKTISPDDLVTAIGRVHQGDAVFSPRLAGFVLDAFAGDLPGEEPMPLHFAGPPHPERRLEPIAGGAQFGHGMRSAADLVDLPVLAEHVVVNFLKPGQLGQQMACEPEKRIKLAEPAQRQFQVGDAPAAQPRAGYIDPGRVSGRLRRSRFGG